MIQLPVLFIFWVAGGDWGDPGFSSTFIKLPSIEKILQHILSSINSPRSNQHSSPLNACYLIQTFKLSAHFQ